MEPKIDGSYIPHYTTEGGLSPSDKVAITGDYHLAFFRVVLWDIRRLPGNKSQEPN